MPASTNFIQFNPTSSNQENDAAYLADALRTAGIQVDNIIPSAMLNKFFYQTSTFITAFCNMLVNKGFSPNDASLSTLTALLATVQTTADGTAAIQTVTFSPTAVFNRAAGQVFQMLLTGNLSAPTLTNLTAGERIVFIFQQDATGGRPVTWPSQIGAQGGTIDSTAPANAVFVQEFIVLANGATVRAISGMTQL